MNRYAKATMAFAAQLPVIIALGLVAHHAQAATRADSVINQAAIYEQTMHFYLHPAHGFPGLPNNNAEPPAVRVHRQGVDPTYVHNSSIGAHAALPLSARPGTAKQPAPATAQALDTYRKQTIAFELNRGQTDPEVDFVARGAGYAAFLSAKEAVLALRESHATHRVVRMSFVGASASPTLVGVEALPGRVNYFRHGQPGPEITQVPTYAKVKAVDVYPGIDVVYYGREGNLEYDFVIAPGVDPDVILLAFEGADRLELDRQGELVLHTAAGELRQRKPVIYQVRDGVRRSVAGDYVLRGSNRVAVRLGAYDRTHALVIDPTLVYSTYLGGSGEESDWLYGNVVDVAVDTAGNAYVTGTTMSSNFPTTSGTDRTRNGNQDAFVTKFSPTGAVLYSTYLGGPCDDIARGIAVNAATGDAYVTGRAHDRCNLATPGVLVAKLGPTGALAYFFIFGGTLADSSIGQAIAVDASGQAYITGLAEANSRDFPTTQGALRGVDCGIAPDASGSDGFVAKVNAAGNGLLYSTYLCGSAHDSMNEIAIDSAGHAYVTGNTQSRDFPTQNAYQGAHPGPGPNDISGFVAKLAPNGAALVYSTYLGGNGDTAALAIAVDAVGQAHVTGSTKASDFPSTAGVVQPVAGNRNCFLYTCTGAFVTKFSAAGSTLVYSTYLDGEGNDAGTGIAVDAAGNAYVAGETASLYFPIVDAFQSVHRALTDDAFVVKLNPNATRLVYSSYLGGGTRPGASSIAEGSDSASGIALHAATGEVYVSGYTTSLDFPTASAFQPNTGGGVCDAYGTPCGDAFVTKITAGGAGVTPPVKLSVSAADVAPGGTITATWAGIPAPTGSDVLRLYLLGALADEWTAVASWPANGAASGSRNLTLPITLAPATYELRLFSPDPDSSGLLGVIARSRPIYVGALPDLVETALSNPPVAVVLGASFSSTDTARNQGTTSAGSSTTRYYLSLDALKSTSDKVLSGSRALPGLAAGAQSTGTVQLRVPSGITPNSYFLLACADDQKVVAEGSETNNCRASGTKVAVTGPELLETVLSNPPAAARVGTSFSVTDTVRNQGTASAAASTTRYYLSLDATKSAGDKLLTGSRVVPGLAIGGASSGSVAVSVSATTVPAAYRLLACADDLNVVAEPSDSNNCRASATTVSVSP